MIEEKIVVEQENHFIFVKKTKRIDYSDGQGQFSVQTVKITYQEAQEVIDKLSEILKEVNHKKEEQKYNYKVTYCNGELQEEVKVHTIEEAHKVARALNGIVHII